MPTNYFALSFNRLKLSTSRLGRIATFLSLVIMSTVGLSINGKLPPVKYLKFEPGINAMASRLLLLKNFINFFKSVHSYGFY